MARLVIPRKPGQALPAGAENAPDDYKVRLVKYIPAESVAFYTFADRMLMDKFPPAADGIPSIPIDSPLAYAPLAFLVLGLVGTPIYFYRQQQQGQPWVLHAIIATIAFAFWAYTTGGSFFLIHHWYDLFYAGLAAPLFTFVAGWFEPK